MSSFTKKTKHPKTGKMQRAAFIIKKYEHKKCKD